MTARAAAATAEAEAKADTDADEAPVEVEVKGVVRVLTRADILAAEDIDYEYLDVPEWGGTLRVRGMTGTERDRYDAESFIAGQKQGGTPLDEFRVRRVAKCIVDDNGLRIFSDQDIAALGQKNGAVLDRIDDVIVRLSKVGEAAVEKEKADLKAVPSDGSGTD